MSKKDFDINEIKIDDIDIDEIDLDVLDFGDDLSKPKKRKKSSDIEHIKGPEKRKKSYDEDKIPGPKKRSNKKKSKSNPEVEKVTMNSRKKTSRNENKKNKDDLKNAAKTSNKNRNKEFAVVTYFFLILFICLCGYFVYFVAFKSDDFINSPYNARLDNMADKVIRGNITDRNGVVLAETNSTNNRNYPYANMYAHAIGYDSNGMSGVELDGNFYMLRSNAFFIERIKNDLTGVKNKGDTVVTTLDHSLQEIAYESMNYDGAVIAIEPSTGKILVMTSKPNFNPNTVEKNWKTLSNSKDSELVNRATQGLYAPGSTFKIITALEYLQENKDAANETFDCTGKLKLDNYTLHCYHNEVHGKQSFKEVFGNSCNIAFGQIGLKINRSGLNAMANQLLFNQAIPSRLSHVSKSRFGVDDNTTENVMVQTAIGQGTTVVTPLHMCMIASAICNGGKLKEPYIMDQVTNYQGTKVKGFRSKTAASLLSDVEAKEIEEYMRYVVTNGTATALNSDKYTAYGKTGTAEFNDNKNDSHAWFVGYAKNGDKELAIAVLQEKGGSGSRTAVPIAKNVFDKYFSMNANNEQ